MGKGQKKGPKDPFADLSDEFKAEVRAANPERVREIIAKNAVVRERMAEELKADQHVKELSEQLKEAKAGYVESDKACRLRIRFSRQELKDRGQPIAGTEN